jgi:hypothetical protein
MPIILAVVILLPPLALHELLRGLAASTMQISPLIMFINVQTEIFEPLGIVCSMRVPNRRCRCRARQTHAISQKPCPAGSAGGNAAPFATITFV